jgi:acetate kinase
MSDAILVINAGSSSIKFALYPADSALEDGPLLHGRIEGVGIAAGTPQLRVSRSGAATETLDVDGASSEPEHCLVYLIGWLRRNLGGHRLVGVGHRVVHGGEHHARPVFIDDAVIRSLEALVPLARLHGPHELAAIRALSDFLPGVRQVACFDTAFHHHRPMLDQLFAIPREYTAAGVRRYGFHGLSYEYIAQRLPAQLGERADGRVVVAHLGNGASMCAMLGRRSLATTMGFTALDGLMMGTRCGAIDPGVLLYAIQERGFSAHEISDILYKRSGLLGVSGLSSDMRDLLASDSPHAHEAVKLFAYRAVREFGALAAVLGGVDAVVFTGGIGERAHEVRAMICDGLRWLGIELDAAANRSHQSLISTAASRITVCVIPTDEEIVIARHTRQLLDAAAPASRA